MVIVLGIACFIDDRRGAIYGLALALCGVIVAGYHTLLIAGVVSKSWIPCGSGVSCTEQKLEILNGVQIPWLSLATFLIIVSLLFVYLKRTSK
jgi:disulfide bond formation protein DsbB